MAVERIQESAYQYVIPNKHGPCVPVQGSRILVAREERNGERYEFTVYRLEDPNQGYIIHGCTRDAYCVVVSCASRGDLQAALKEIVEPETWAEMTAVLAQSDRAVP